MGSQWKGRNVGAVGDLVTFSFHPNKNMTTIEGGALVVNDADEAARVEALRFHGIVYLPDRTRDVAFPGGKFNLPDVNARIGVRAARAAARVPRARGARSSSATSSASRPIPPACCRRVRRAGDGQSWNMWSVLLPLDRLTVTPRGSSAMRSRRGASAPVYRTRRCTCRTLGRRYGYGRAIFRTTERIARETVTLPLHAGMTAADVDRVCAAVAEVIARHASERRPLSATPHA